MRAVVSSLVALSLLLCLPVWAASSLDLPTQKMLARLEKKYFDDNFNTDSDELRVERLEKLVFGESVPGSPQQRIERLVAVVASETGSDLSSDKVPPPAGQSQVVPADAPTTSSAQAEGSADDTPVANQDDYPHVTALEKAILGQSFAGQSLSARFSRMETKAFGNPSSNPDFSQRTDALEKYAEKDLHKQPFGGTKREAPAPVAQSGGMPQQLLNLAGNSLLSMAGMGFSGVRVRPRQEVSEEPHPQAPTPEEDPEVYEAVPPPPEAKLIVKVGWCENQIFGHTFPQIHLLGRLGQLNQELKVKPNESNMQLMDDIGAMIKAAQARKSASAK